MVGTSSTSARSTQSLSTVRSGRLPTTRPRRRYTSSPNPWQQNGAPYNIRVNAIAPGYVKTEMAPVDDPAHRQHWIDDVPMKRFALPEEIAPTVVYMASDASSFMTGSIVVIDGGYTVY